MPYKDRKKKNEYERERYHRVVKPRRAARFSALDEEELSGTGLSLPPPPVELEISHDSEHGKENESDHPLLIPAPQLHIPLSVSLPPSPSPPLTEEDFLPDGDDATTIDPCQDFYETDSAEYDEPDAIIHNIDFVNKENEILSDYDEEEETLEVKLFKYQREAALSQGNMNKLLKMLRDHGHLELPSDCRSLKFDGIKTEVAFETNRIVYFGIRESFKRYPDKCFIGQSTIELRLFVDGLPFGKASTPISFWPILMTTNLLPDHVSVIGLYCGPHPHSEDIFIKQFVNELNELHIGEKI